MKHDYLIVGGGIGGLLAARILAQRGLDFIGVEKASRLGGRAELGPHRLLKEASVEFLKAQVPDMEWLELSEEPKERNKGEYKSLGDKYEDQERFYLTSNYFTPKGHFDSFVEQMAEPVRDKFLLNKSVEAVLADEKKVELIDGTQIEYEKLIWCVDLSLLLKLWKAEKSLALKAAKALTENLGGIDLFFNLKAPIFAERNTVVFPFRYKEWKLKALGIPEFDDQGTSNRLHWILFLDSEITEDREEIAKCVRTLKRELQKEFPELKDQILNEKIGFMPVLSGEGAVDLKSLTIYPGVFYLGPQSQNPDQPEELMNLDRLIFNGRAFEAQLAGSAEPAQ